MVLCGLQVCKQEVSALCFSGNIACRGETMAGAKTTTTTTTTTTTAAAKVLEIGKGAPLFRTVFGSSAFGQCANANETDGKRTRVCDSKKSSELKFEAEADLLPETVCLSAAKIVQHSQDSPPIIRQATLLTLLLTELRSRRSRSTPRSW